MTQRKRGHVTAHQRRARIEALKKRRSIEEIVQANEAAGFHFFNPRTVKRFSSRFSRETFEGGFFVSSERIEPGWERRYTVCRSAPDGSIETVSDFQEYASLNGAKKRAEREAARGTREAISQSPSEEIA